MFPKTGTTFVTKCAIHCQVPPSATEKLSLGCTHGGHPVQHEDNFKVR